MSADTIRLETFTITTEALCDGMDQEILVASPRIIGNIRKNPQLALDEAEQLMKKYPNQPQLYNWRLSAYQAMGMELEELTQLKKEDYERFPHYLFAKAAYAQICLDQDKIDDAAKVFEGAATIKQLYPERELFHYREAIAFSSIQCQLACHADNYDLAKIHYDLVLQLDDSCDVADMLTHRMVIYFGHPIPKNILSRWRSLFNEESVKKKKVKKVVRK